MTPKRAKVLAKDKDCILEFVGGVWVLESRPLMGRLSLYFTAAIFRPMSEETWGVYLNLHIVSAHTYLPF